MKNINNKITACFYLIVKVFFKIIAIFFYKIKIINSPQINKNEGALIVANHITYLDAILMMISMNKPLRFVVDKRIYNIPFLKPFLILLNVITVSSKDSPKQIKNSLDSIRKAIENKQAVLMFAEGQVTRTGNTLKLKKGFQYVIKGLDVKIIAACLDGIWGSIFSFHEGKVFLKRPRFFKRRITVIFSETLSAGVNAFDIRCKILELGAEAFKYRLNKYSSLPEEFLKSAKKKPFSFCMGDVSGKKMNRAEVFIAAMVLAKNLRKTLKDKEYVGIMLPSSIGGALANVSLSMLGKKTVNLNFTVSDDILSSSIKQCDMDIVISSTRFLKRIKKEVPAEIIFLEDILKKVKKREKIFASMCFFLLPVFVLNKIIFRNKNNDINEVLTIIFTSGSTGDPKGVMLTHSNIAADLEGIYQIINSEKHIIMGILPFFHSFGYTTLLWLPLVKGLKIVFHVNPLDAKIIGGAINKFKATLLFSTPSFLKSYLKRCTKEQLESLELVVTGAEKLKSKISDDFKDKFGVVPMEGYGCSEVSPVVSFSIPDYKKKDIHQRSYKKGKIGMTIPGVAVKILDPKTKKRVGADQSGILYVKGAIVMKGYLNKPQITKEVISDGWYCTSDIANMDEDGFLKITDRLSRFSKIAGEMIPHIKIEEEIHKIFNEEEQFCVIISVEDEIKGEKLMVFLTKDLSPSYIVDKLHQTSIPNLWIPQAQNFYKIKEIPLLGSGKIDLVKMKKKAEELNL